VFKVALVVLVGLCVSVAEATPRLAPKEPTPYMKKEITTKLYTETPWELGGMTGKLQGVSDVIGILAVSRERQKFYMETALLGGGMRKETKFRIAVYFAEYGDDLSFKFSGLAEGTYDLFVMTGSAYYNGIRLFRRNNVLTPKSVNVITAKLKETNPYFNEKHVARMGADPGKPLSARVLIQEVRTLPVTDQDAIVWHDIQTRSIKLMTVEDVTLTGDEAWMVLDSREIVRQEVGPPDRKGAIPEYFCQALSGITVIDEVVDLGTINITRDPAPK